MDSTPQSEGTIPSPPRCEGEIDCENPVVALFLGTGAKMCIYCATRALSELSELGKEINTDITASPHPISNSNS
jgi:hypothetical protein